MGVLSVEWRRPAKVNVNHVGGPDKAHLNSRLLPTNVNAPTDFKYLTTDATNDAPYQKA